MDKRESEIRSSLYVRYRETKMRHYHVMKSGRGWAYCKTNSAQFRPLGNGA